MRAAQTLAGERALRRLLLRWYEPRRGAYPWRRSRPDPYAVLVSEIMLQQTQASRVAPAFERFLIRFPHVRALAAAPRSEVLRAWDGLGYNRRSLALSAAARAIVAGHGGKVPSDPAALRRLPGVGEYTAAAIASVAHGVSVPAIDVNVRRVVARALLGVDAAEARPSEVREAAGRWLDPRRPGDWNQALMDLGREVCRPASPRCDACPVAAGCAFRALGRSPVPLRRPTAPFEGSARQIRGRVVGELRRRRRASLADLARACDRPLDRVASAVRALAADGVVAAGPAALAGRAGGVVRLPEG